MGDSQEVDRMHLKTTVHDISLDFNSFVAIAIGQETTKTYTVSKDLICHYSSYFSSAFKDNFREGQECRIHLPEVEDATFNTFLRWLYSQELPWWHKDPKAQRTLVQQWCELYVFADFAGVPKLRRELVEEYVEWLIANDTVRARCPGKTASYVYSNTPSTSPLRRLVLEDYYSTVLRDLSTLRNQIFSVSEDELLPHRFCLDLVRKAMVRLFGGTSKLKYVDFYDDEILKLLGLALPDVSEMMEEGTKRDGDEAVKSRQT